MQEISTQNRGFKAIFDAGASEIIISDCALRKLKNIKIEPELKEYKYFDGGVNKTFGTAISEFVFARRIFQKV